MEFILFSFIKAYQLVLFHNISTGLIFSSFCATIAINPFVKKSYGIAFREKIHNLDMKETLGDFFLGGGFGGLFAIWSISSHMCVQIDREMVQLI